MILSLKEIKLNYELQDTATRTGREVLEINVFLFCFSI